MRPSLVNGDMRIIAACSASEAWLALFLLWFSHTVERTMSSLDTGKRMVRFRVVWTRLLELWEFRLGSR